jgi:hypothetical protein
LTEQRTKDNKRLLLEDKDLIIEQGQLVVEIVGFEFSKELKKRILEDQRIANELRDMYEKSKKFIEDSPDAWDADLIEHFIQKAEFILKGMIQKTG